MARPARAILVRLLGTAQGMLAAQSFLTAMLVIASVLVGFFGASWLVGTVVAMITSPLPPGVPGGFPLGLVCGPALLVAGWGLLRWARRLERPRPPEDPQAA